LNILELSFVHDFNFLTIESEWSEEKPPAAGGKGYGADCKAPTFGKFLILLRK